MRAVDSRGLSRSVERGVMDFGGISYRAWRLEIERIVPDRDRAEGLLKRSDQLLSPRALKPVFDRRAHRTGRFFLKPLFEMLPHVLLKSLRIDPARKFGAGVTSG